MASLCPRQAGSAAALAVVVAVIHLQDQGWLAFQKTPLYVQVAYVLLEIGCLAIGTALLVRPVRIVWLLALGCGAGPFAGYILSRGPGLPLYTDDVGNWAEPLGLVALVVEGMLIALSLSVLTGMSTRVAERARAVVA